MRDGYRAGQTQWQADNLVATRLEEPPRVAVRLATACDGALRPLAQDKRWESSEISVTATWASGLRPPDAAQKTLLAPAWDESDESVRLLVLQKRGESEYVSNDGYLYARRSGLCRSEGP